MTPAGILTLVAAPAACLFAAALHAQAVPGDTVPPVPLDTVTVTAVGPAIPTERAPYAVSTVDEHEIRHARPGLALDEALRALPGVHVDSRYNYSLGERVSIRGFGARAQFGVRGIRVLVDGIPATLPDGQTTLNHVDVAMLGRAEVLRGPAAALYGNASGGVIRLSSAPAPYARVAPHHRVLAGSHGLLRLESSAAGRAGRVSYRASASRLRFGGYREHHAADNALAGMNVGYVHGPDELRFAMHLVGFDALNPGSLTDSMLRVDRRQAFAFNRVQRTGQTGRQGQAGVTWRRAAGAGALEVAAYGTGRSIVNPIPNRVIDLDRRAGGIRGGWSGAAPGGVRWAAGAEAEVQRDDRLNHVNEGGERGTLTLDQLERVRSTSAFGHLLAPLVPRLDATAALRYDRFRFSAHDRLVSETDPDDSGVRRMDQWSPTAGLTFRPAAGLTLYGNVATAFETPTTTELANRPEGAGGFNPDLEPQRTRSYEVGARARVAAWARLEGAAYHADVRDALIPFEVAGAPGRQFFRNAGRARHRGVELAAVAAPRRGWTARGAYSWTDARFTRYVVGGDDLAGNRVPGIAPHRVEAAVTSRPRTGPSWGVDARRVGAVPVTDRDADGSLASPAYTVADVRGGWSAVPLGTLALDLFGGITNLFDTEFNTAVAVNAFGGRYYEPGPGRSFHAGGTLRLMRSTRR